MSSRLKSDKEIDSDILTIQEELKGKSKWQQYLIVDLLTVRQFSLKSMIDNEQKKVVEKKIETLYKMIQKSNMIKVDQMEREIKPEDYYFIMNYVGNTLEDDHSHINLQQFMQTQQVRYKGFLCMGFLNQDNEKEVFVIHSIIKQLDVGDRISHVNDMRIVDFLKQVSSFFNKKTYSQIVQQKKVCLMMCIQNPFFDIHSIRVEKKNKHFKDSITISTDEVFVAKEGYFKKKPVFEFINDVILGKRTQVTQATQLGIMVYNAAKIVYIHIHEHFPAFGPELNNVLMQAQLINADDYKWVVIDIRNNVGGSLALLYMLTVRLFGQVSFNSLSKCSQTEFATEKSILKFYIDQYILPVLSDPEVSPQIKQVYVQMKKKLSKHLNSGHMNEQHKNEGCSNVKFVKSLVNMAKQYLKDKSMKRVLVINNTMCFSACIWTRNFLQMFPNVLVIGTDVGYTNGTGNSLKIQLPSEQGFLYIPQCIASNSTPYINEKIRERTTNPDISVSEYILNNQEELLVYILENKMLFEEKLKQKSLNLLKKNDASH